MKTVVYCISGPAYLPYLVTSISSLRRHFSGRIEIFAWPESLSRAREVAADPNVRAEAHPVARASGKNGHLIQRIDIMRGCKGTSLFLDADTLIAGNLDELFRCAESTGYAASQFGDWTTDKSLIRDRLEQLRPFVGNDDEQHLNMLLQSRFPSLNGGVFCCRRNSPVMDSWLRLSQRARLIFIPDECAQHLLMTKHPREVSVLLGGRFNTSPMFQPKRLPDRLVAIWHGHGNMFAQPEKCQRAVEMWLREYRAAQGIAGLRSWVRLAGNAKLNALLESLDPDSV